MAHNPHDHYFRFTFGQLDHAQEFLETTLPKDVRSLLMLDKLALKSGSYIDEQLEEHLSDIIYEVPFQTVGSDEAPASIYCLFEHKSTPELWVQLQLLRYMYERWMADAVDGKQLQPILSIVFYHGKRDWTIPTSFLEQFEGVEPIFHRFIPNFDYILFDINKYGDEQLQTLISSGSLQASLLLLKYIYDELIGERLPDIMEPLAEAELSPERRVAQLRAMIRYLTSTANKVDEKVLKEAVTQVFSEGDGVMSTIAERWLAQGEEKGIEQGKIIVCRVIMQTLQSRFTTVPNKIQTMLSHCSLEQLNDVSNIALSASTINEFSHSLQKLMAGDTLEQQNTHNKVVNKQKETVQRILNHRFNLDEEQARTIIQKLALIHTEGELDTLLNFALTAHDLERFIEYLPNHDKTTVT